MHLVFLRHGEADWPKWDRPDDERPLTDHGKKEMRQVATFLHALKIALDEIVTSPLPRARQTAEIVADRFDLEVTEEKTIAENFDVTDLKQLVRNYSVDDLMIVGHEPSFTNVIGEVTGAHCKLSKGGVALVDLDAKEMKGRLLWLFPPKFAKLLQ